MSWSDFLVLSLVAGAAAYVARRMYFALQGEKAGCGSACGNCASGSSKDKRGVLLTIDPPARPGA